jgi:hypothetical protein
MTEEEKQQKANIIKGLWSALTAPTWRKDDLIDFGMAIHGRLELKDLPPKRFSLLLPYLSQIADEIAKRFDIKAKDQTVTPPATPAAPEVSS